MSDTKRIRDRDQYSLNAIRITRKYDEPLHYAGEFYKAEDQRRYEREFIREQLEEAAA